MHQTLKGVGKKTVVPSDDVDGEGVSVYDEVMNGHRLRVLKCSNNLLKVTRRTQRHIHTQTKHTHTHTD